MFAALSCTAALIVYPVAIKTEQKLDGYTLGPGYGLGWGAAIFFMLAAFTLCLDDLYRAAAGASASFKCCRKADDNGNSRV